jgi:ATP-binding cassette, subfamily B, bacterial PglK
VTSEPLAVVWQTLTARLKMRVWAAVAAGLGAAIAEGLTVVALYVFMSTLANGFSLPSGRAFDWIGSWMPGSTSQGLMLALGLLTIVVLIAKATFTFLSAMSIASVVRDARRELVAGVLSQAFSRPYAALADEPKGDLRHAIAGEVDRVCFGTLHGIFTLCVEGVVLVGLVAVLSIKNVEVTGWSALVLTCLAVSLHLVIRRPGSHIGEQLSIYGQRRLSLLIDILDGMRVIKTTNSASFFVQLLDSANARYFRTQMHHELIFQAPRLLVETVAMVLLVVVVIFAAGETASSAEIVGALSLYAAAAYRMMPSVVRGSGALVQLRTCRPALDSVVRRLRPQDKGMWKRDLTPQNVYAESSEPPRVAVEAVSYRFAEGDGPALNNISFSVEPGCAMGIMGANGAGKSTLIDVLLGLRPPSSGVVSADGTPIEELGEQQWHTIVGYVPQDIFVLPSSLLENVAFGVAPEAIDQEAAHKALEAVGLTRLIARFEVPTHEGEPKPEIRLSGGERQRLAIARALYRSPRVLIMDEATSALDKDAEKLVTNAVEQLRGKATLIVVAHKLQALSACDEVIVLDEGRIVQRDSFDTFQQHYKRRDDFP